MSQVIRIFYAHPSGEDKKTIAKQSIRIRELVRGRGDRVGKDLRVSVISGRDDFRINCRGDWSVWAKSVVKREHAITRKPYYDFIVIPSTTVGRATAQIVGLAVKRGRPVFLLTTDQDKDRLERVTQVYPFDVDDWQGGFRCEGPPSPKEPGEGSEQLELPLELKGNPNG